jgi:hypothetical protein
MLSIFQLQNMSSITITKGTQETNLMPFLERWEVLELSDALELCNLRLISELCLRKNGSGEAISNSF